MPLAAVLFHPACLVLLAGLLARLARELQPLAGARVGYLILVDA